MDLFKESDSRRPLKKWVLSRRESSEMVQSIESSLGKSLGLSRSAQAKCAEPAEGVVFIDVCGFVFVKESNNKWGDANTAADKAEDRFIPFLGCQSVLDLFPSMVVDEGAIRFLLNGADVMRPGVRRLDDWGPAGAVVVVKEEKKGRAIAVGLSTTSGTEASAMTKGSCLKNLHYVGDKYWNLHKQL